MLEIVTSIFGFRRLVPTYGIRIADERIREVKHATGACLFIRTEALKAVGLLDERLYFSMEDADICMRVRLAGWNVHYVPAVRVVHFGGGSRGKMSDNGMGAMLLSSFRFYRKYHGLTYATVVHSVMAVGALLQILAAGALCTFGVRGEPRWRRHVSQGLQVLRCIWRPAIAGKGSALCGA
jgi:hypothetical protein